MSFGTPLAGCEIVFMNFFYDLPYDIQKKIYFEAHKLKYKDTFKKMCKFLELDFDDNYYNVVEFINAYS